jgi:hypothetical protein
VAGGKAGWGGREHCAVVLHMSHYVKDVMYWALLRLCANVCLLGPGKAMK